MILGYYFIDRNPSQFEEILDVLRTGDMSKVDEHLKEELQYYGLPFDLEETNEEYNLNTQMKSNKTNNNELPSTTSLTGTFLIIFVIAD